MKDKIGEILNNKVTMEYQSATRQLNVKFKNLQLKKFKRSEQRWTESVMEEKFALLFQTNFKVGGDLDFHVWVNISLRFHKFKSFFLI